MDQQTFDTSAFDEAPAEEEDDTPFVVEDLRLDLRTRKVAPRKWLYGRSLLIGHSSFMGAPGGVGKTTLAIAIALSVALGKAILDPSGTDKAHKVHRQRKVWFYNLEDPTDEMERRIQAAFDHYKIKDKDWHHQIKLTSGRTQPLVVATRDAKTGTVIRTPKVKKLTAALKENDIGLLVVDPFIHSHDLDENSNGEMGNVLQLWNQVAEDSGCAILLIHHFRKGGTGGDAEAFRGAAAIQGGARVMETCRTMNEKEAVDFSIEAEHERKFYFRWDNAKQNMAPASQAQWFKLIGVDLGNATTDYPEGDNAQTLIRFTPEQRKRPRIHSTQAERIFKTVIEALDNGQPFSRNKGSRWIGSVFMQVLGCNADDAYGYGREWLDRGLLHHDPKGWKNKDGNLRGCIKASLLYRNHLEGLRVDEAKAAAGGGNEADEEEPE